MSIRGCAYALAITLGFILLSNTAHAYANPAANVYTLEQAAENAEAQDEELERLRQEEAELLQELEQQIPATPAAELNEDDGEVLGLEAPELDEEETADAAEDAANNNTNKNVNTTLEEEREPEQEEQVEATESSDAARSDESDLQAGGLGLAVIALVIVAIVLAVVIHIKRR